MKLIRDGNCQLTKCIDLTRKLISTTKLSVKLIFWSYLPLVFKVFLRYTRSTVLFQLHVFYMKFSGKKILYTRYFVKKLASLQPYLTKKNDISSKLCWYDNSLQWLFNNGMGEEALYVTVCGCIHIYIHVTYYS